MVDFVKKTLSNGIVVYFFPDENMKQFIASYNIKYGSCGYYEKFYYKDKLYEVPPAIAHFLEHTLIEESKYGNMLHYYKSLNYEVNGLTYPEMTSYYFVGIKDTKESLKKLIEMVDDPVFDSEAIVNVKGAIVEEVSKVGDNKYRIGYNINRRNMFKNFEYVNDTFNTLGSKETTEAITYEDVKLCYDAFYNDENKFLVIGGNFQIDEMVEFLESVYKNIKPHPNSLKHFDYSDEFEVRKEFEEIVKPVDTDLTIITYKFHNTQKYPMLVKDLYFHLFGLLKFSGDSDFIKRLSKEKIITDGVGYGSDFFNGVISFTLSAYTLDSEKFIEECQKELLKEIDSEDRFNLYKKSFKVNELNKLIHKYYYIKDFALGIDFSEKLFCINEISSLNYREFKQFVSELKFDTKSITIVRSDEKK